MAEHNRNKHAHNFKDLTGQVFGRLTVIELAESHDDRHIQWVCLCQCGTVTVKMGDNIKAGRAKSCGCLRIQRSREQRYIDPTFKKEHSKWAGAKDRCFNPNNISFHRYGGRGITMCERWCDSFLAFLEDMGACPVGYTLERKNVNGNYEPDNCCWIPAKLQARNRRTNVWITHDGVTKTMAEWAEITGIPYSTLQQRHFGGSSVPMFDRKHTNQLG